MTLYKVDYSYMEPGWDDILVEADTKEEAKEIATQRIAQAYPEAQDFEIVEVEEIKKYGKDIV